MPTTIYPDGLSNTPRLPAFRVTFRCTDGHAQEIVWYGSEEAWVRGWAGLVDGTSPLYVRPPSDSHNSVIGRCGICCGRLRSEVENIEHEVVIEAQAAGCAAAMWNTHQAAPRSCTLCAIGPCHYGVTRNPLPEER